MDIREHLLLGDLESLNERELSTGAQFCQGGHRLVRRYSLGSLDDAIKAYANELMVVVYAGAVLFYAKKVGRAYVLKGSLSETIRFK
jgi:hypothetical protein